MLAAAQQPCPACGKPLLGEQPASSFKAPAPGYHEDLPRADAGKPRAQLSFTGAIVGVGASPAPAGEEAPKISRADDARAADILSGP